MKKKAGKTSGKRRRPAVKDLPASDARQVKGGDKASFSEIKIVKTVDKASPSL